MSRIIDAALAAIPGSLANSIASILDEQPAQCSAALKAAITSVMGLLTAPAAEEKYLPTLLRIVNDGGFDPSALSRLKIMEVEKHSEELLNSGAEMAKGLLGSEAERISLALSTLTRIRPESALAILGAGCVFVFGALGQSVLARPVSVGAMSAALKESAKKQSNPQSTTSQNATAQTTLPRPQVVQPNMAADLSAPNVGKLPSPASLVPIFAAGAAIALGALLGAAFLFNEGTSKTQIALPAPRGAETVALAALSTTEATAVRDENPPNMGLPLAETLALNTTQFIPAAALPIEESPAAELGSPLGSNNESPPASLQILESAARARLNIGGLDNSTARTATLESAISPQLDSQTLSSQQAQQPSSLVEASPAEGDPEIQDASTSFAQAPEQLSENDSQLLTTLTSQLESTEKLGSTAPSLALEGIKFLPGSARIDGKAPSSFSEIAATLLKFPRARIQISVFADTSGSPRARHGLSQLRAETLKRQLTKLGISTSRIDVVGIPLGGRVEEHSEIAQLRLIRK